MSKKVLIIVLSSDWPPYDKMIQTSKETWDSIEVEGVTGTIYACGIPIHQEKENAGSVMYFNTGDTLFDMGKRNIAVFDWALKNIEFDYVARLNASCYCDKKLLIDFVQNLPEENLFMGVETKNIHGEQFCWGGCMYIISKDVIQKIVDNKERMRNENRMEDETLSMLVSELGISFTSGIKSCSVDKNEQGWQLTSYCGQSKSFVNFDEVKENGHIFYRCKQDQNREKDKFIMEELFRVLN